MDVSAAVDVVARFIVARSYSSPAASVHDVDWGDFPDIDEHDWAAVTERATEIAVGLMPAPSEYATAYGVLSDRANDTPTEAPCRA